MRTEAPVLGERSPEEAEPYAQMRMVRGDAGGEGTGGLRNTRPIRRVIGHPTPADGYLEENGSNIAGSCASFPKSKLKIWIFV